MNIDFKDAAERELYAKLAEDPLLRLETLYKIVVKGGDDDDDGLVMTFKPNAAQRKLIRRMWHRNLILKARQLGFCVSPETRVLTAGLEWIPIGQIKPGTEVIACDEHPPGGRGSARKMRTATVQAVKTMRAERFRITFDDGRQVVCTDRHPWLSKKVATDAKWRSISGEGNSVTGKLTVGTKVRWVAKPWDEPAFEDGWFGGMLDGEGSISKRNSSAGVNVSQRYGPVWDRLVKYATDRGYNACVENDVAERPSKHGRVPVPKLAFGRMDEMFRLIGQTRPSRFLGNRFWEGRELPGKRNGDVGWATVTSIEAIGEGDVVDMQTTTGTYIAEGFVSHNTTLVCILWLDTALWSKEPIRCGIIAQDLEAAGAIFRGKVQYAYNALPDFMKAWFPLSKKTASELEFGHNGSSIRVATSMRSGTIHRLHISEFGKICAKYPDKAQEVVTGSIPAVPKSGICIIESTAEGQDGKFYEMTMRAQALAEQGTDLTVKDWRFHFYAWWMAPEYTVDPDGVVFSETDLQYFNQVEAKIGRVLTEGQRAWYVTTRRADFADEAPLMWQEYPSFPEEAFQVSTEGCYYATQIANARKQGRILKTLPLEAAPVNTFWDIGRGDMTAIWCHQRVGPENRWIKYYEASGEDLSHYADWLQKLGVPFGVHYLPHEADYRRMGENPDTNKTLKEMLERLMPGQRFEVVPRVTNISAGIQSTRNQFASCWFSEEGCEQGIKRLSNYRKQWDKTQGRWKDEPKHDDNSHGSDAFRQFGQVADAGAVFRTEVAAVRAPGAGLFKRRGSAMAR